MQQHVNPLWYVSTAWKFVTWKFTPIHFQWGNDCGIASDEEKKASLFFWPTWMEKLITTLKWAKCVQALFFKRIIPLSMTLHLLSCRLLFFFSSSAEQSLCNNSAQLRHVAAFHSGALSWEHLLSPLLLLWIFIKMTFNIAGKYEAIKEALVFWS